MGVNIDKKKAGGGIAGSAVACTETGQIEGYETKKVRALRTLAGGSAADFKDILSAIRGYVELVQLDLPAQSPARKHLEDVLNAVDRGDDLALDLLSYSQSVAKLAEPESIDGFIQKAIDQFVATVPKSIKVKTSLSGDAGRVRISAKQVKQIVTNLCTNASDAMIERGGTLHVELSATQLDDPTTAGLCGIEPGPYAAIRVSDTGCGMRPDISERIFEPYFSMSENGAGSGMGLALVYGIVQACHGALYVESEVGKGSAFTVYLPRETS